MDADFLGYPMWCPECQGSVWRDLQEFLYGRSKRRNKYGELAWVKPSEQVLSQGYKQVSSDSSKNYFLAAPMEQT